MRRFIVATVLTTMPIPTNQTHLHSLCLNTPIADYSSAVNSTANMRLFQIESVSDNADVYFAVVNNYGWVGDYFQNFYGIIAVGFVVVGIAQVLSKTDTTPYVLTMERERCPIWFRIPAIFSMQMYTYYSGVSSNFVCLLVHVLRRCQVLVPNVGPFDSAAPTIPISIAACC
jgi:hypothetical protein